nr:TPA_asm: YRec [Powellomyces chytrid fungus MELD virus 5]
MSQIEEPKNYMNFTIEDVRDIFNSDCQKKSGQFTVADSCVVRAFKIIQVAGADWKRPDLVKEKITPLIKTKKGAVENSKGQWLSSFATFLRRTGCEHFDMQSLEFDSLVKRYNSFAGNLRGTYNRNRANGKPSESELRKPIPKSTFPELKARAMENYLKQKELFYKSTRENMSRFDYETLMRAVFMLCYTEMPNIRSLWADITGRDFDMKTENGIIESYEEMYLLFNRRKMNTTCYLQRIPDELAAILRQWTKYNNGLLFVDFRREKLNKGNFGKTFVRTWKKLCDEDGIGFRRIRKIHCTHCETTEKDPRVRRRLAREFHHSYEEHQLYFQEVHMADNEFVGDDGESKDEEEYVGDNNSEEGEEIEIEIDA